jgi:transposase
MFVRQKKNKSGIISVQVIDKSTGKYKLLKTLGSDNNQNRVKQLVVEAEIWIKNKLGQTELSFSNENELVELFFHGISQITVIGTELLLSKLYNQIGFNQIADDLLRQLVIARICYPSSKLKTTDYLAKYQSVSVDVDKIYRYLDKLESSQKEDIQQISYNHTIKILNNEMSVVFYDVTTLYFEIEKEDELRKTGFSKDGKHQNPQIVLGLLVSIDGYPLAYDIFEGNKFEGQTMLPIIDGFKMKYNLNKIVIIADSGLFSAENIASLQSKGYEYILGARIKAEKKETKALILALNLTNGESAIIVKDENTRLIISYSLSRAKKDKANRDKGLEKLKKSIKSGSLTKANLNNRGYNKYLKLTGKAKISIDETKYKEDEKWDGLKGYITNTELEKQAIIENYGQLWKIEKAFRVTKHDIKIRPIFHRLKRRIEAHICISFMAYKLYKELERLLREKKSELSPEKAIEIAKTIYSITVITPKNRNKITKTIITTQEQQVLVNLFEL